MSAEYIMAGGNEQVILCERGIRTFEKYTRNTLDLSAVPVIQEKTHLPIIVDPSHATGKANGWWSRWPWRPWPPVPTAWNRGARQPPGRLERRCPVPEAG